MIKVLIILFCSFLCFPVYGSGWPTRPIRIIVPFPIGGANDFVARALAENISKHLNISVIVTNHPGASGTTATVAYINRDFDDHMFLLGSSNNLVFSPILTKKHNIEDLKYIALTGRGHYYLISRSNEEIENLLKSKRKLFYGSGGINTGSHLAMLTFIKNNNMDITHIPYLGTKDALLGLLRNEVDVFMISGLSSIKTLINSGEIKILEESKDLYSWYGIVSRRDLSSNKTNILMNALKEIYESKSMHKTLEEQGLSPIWVFGEEFEKYIYDEHNKWEKILKDVKQ